MNYYEWSLEYKDSADEFENIINKLKARKLGKTNTEKKELDSKIAKYKTYYDECMLISKHLMARYKGVE